MSTSLSKYVLAEIAFYWLMLRALLCVPPNPHHHTIPLVSHLPWTRASSITIIATPRRLRQLDKVLRTKKLLSDQNECMVRCAPVVPATPSYTHMQDINPHIHLPTAPQVTFRPRIQCVVTSVRCLDIMIQILGIKTLGLTKTSCASNPVQNTANSHVYLLDMEHDSYGIHLIQSPPHTILPPQQPTSFWRPQRALRLRSIKGVKYQDDFGVDEITTTKMVG